MDFLIAGITDKGIVKTTNQDSFDMKCIETTNGKLCFAVLCDGMGGLAKGEVASSSLVYAFSEWIETRLSSCLEIGLTEDVIRREWSDILQNCNEKISAYGSRNSIRLGTTVTAILLSERWYYIVNVGDTRCYEISDSVRQITTDHTVVQREVDQGLLTPEQAKTDRRRSVLTQCIGAGKKLSPDFYFGPVKEGKVFMLCTDGFRHNLEADDIYQAFNPDSLSNAEMMNQHIKRMINLVKSSGEKDNITTLVIKTV